MKKFVVLALASALSLGAAAQPMDGYWIPNIPSIPIKLTPMEACTAWVAQANVGNTSGYMLVAHSVEQVPYPYPIFNCMFTFSPSNPNYWGPIPGTASSAIRNTFPGCEEYGCRKE